MKKLKEKVGEKGIALYVSGPDVTYILEEYSEFSIKCLVNDENFDRYERGYYVVNLNQFFDLEIADLVITAGGKRGEEIYDCISAKCRSCHINLYNKYGMDLFLLHSKALQWQIDYPQLWEKDIENAIDSHNVISFDLGGTLFTSYLCAEDFYEELQKRFIDAGKTIENFALRVQMRKPQMTRCTFKDIIRYLGEEDKIGTEEFEEIWKIVKREVKKTFYARKAVVEAMLYAIKQKKRVYVIEDIEEYRLPADLWGDLLKEQGIVAGYELISGTEYNLEKSTGLYEKVTQSCETGGWLHIGDEIYEDFMVPMFYGADTFCIKSAREIYNLLDPIAALNYTNRGAKQAIDNYILDVYNDEYLLNKSEDKRCQMTENARNLENKIRLYQNCDQPVTFQPIIFESIPVKGSIEEYTKLQFPVVEEPVVSIVIPVYNQFVYTYNCLRSILNHTKDVAYEVIVADDGSNDYVSEIEKILSNVTVIHNENNLKFLLNCNNAVTYAKGKYILLLNNDTQVQPEWLQVMIDLAEADETIGVVGSKLVYPEGYLQEAGGILWKDGSAWNYGHLKDPDDPEYNYVKEVDYVSGASIMIRKELWTKLGGFDERFAPAYYEDTDLAFSVRQQGYKVVYQPKSIVVHFEGISNGTDVSSGLKAYQATNQQKFFRKWMSILQKEHFDNGTKIYLAKDRGQTKKQILVIDHYVPNYDKDAGGRCTFMYIKAFLKMGMKVTFIGDNFARLEPYTTMLTQLGVEILYGNFYYNNWRNWLKENLQYFDYIYLQRPHISIKYIDIVRAYGKGKVFYFAHDLHYIRTYRSYQITGNKESLLESEKWKKIEMELFEKTDVGHVVGSYEQKVIQEIFPAKPIRNISLYIFDKLPEEIEKDFSKRKDILFVGGFNHEPNKDAVLWFAESVFPGLKREYPDLKWHIVGSNASQEICELAENERNIILEGFVSDVELEKLYRECRIVVAPLRYGAGVKGKIIEATYYQIPVVTTSVGGEGIDDTLGAFIMEDESERMKTRLIELYSDFTQLQKMSDAGKTLIERYYSVEVAENILRLDMDV